ncbi:hypothetical protein C8Q75DRAFT_805551 [Abortiporus biennis]|nr:hypothetical protein C8Q75DRAFT_805551 [Abortiporus biennis]
MVDGLHIVHLPDKAEDVAKLLNAIYNPATLTFRRHDPDMPVKATKLMRLAEKYEVESVQKIIINHIKSEWPRNVYEWDVLQQEIKNVARNYDECEAPDINDMFSKPAAALRFAMEFDCPSILPAVLYTFI